MMADIQTANGKEPFNPNTTSYICFYTEGTEIMTLDTMGRRTTVSWLWKALGSSKCNSWTQWTLKHEAEFMMDKGSKYSFIHQPFARTQAWVWLSTTWDTPVSGTLPQRVQNRGRDRWLKSALRFPVFGEQEGKLSAEICCCCVEKEGPHFRFRGQSRWSSVRRQHYNQRKGEKKPDTQRRLGKKGMSQEWEPKSSLAELHPPLQERDLTFTKLLRWEVGKPPRTFEL